VTAASILRSVWRRRLLALYLLCFVGLSGGVFLSTQEEIYESSVSVALLPLPDETGSTASSLPFYSEAVRSLLPTYAEVVESGVVLGRVVDELDDGTTIEDLEDSVFVRTLPDSAVVSVVAQAGSAQLSADTADLTAQEFVEEVRAGRVLEGRLLDAAQVPQTPIAPNRPLAVAAIVLLSLAVAGSGALLFDRLLGRIETLPQLEEASDTPVLGSVSYDKRLRRDAPRVVVDDQAFPSRREDLRHIHANLLFALRQHPHSLVAVTSLHSVDGKSMVVADLAVTAAEYGRDTILIDADLVTPTQHSVFGIAVGHGLTAAEHSGLAPEQLLQSTAYSRLKLVPAGAALSDRASEVGVYLRQLPRFADLAELVLIDAPPLNSTADARMLAASVGAVIVVVKAGSTTPSRLQGTIEDLERVGVEVLGLVLARTRSRDWSRRWSGGGSAAAPTKAGADPKRVTFRQSVDSSALHDEPTSQSKAPVPDPKVVTPQPKISSRAVEPWSAKS